MRNQYLFQLITVKALKRAIYYSAYQATKEYIALTSLTIAKAVFISVKQKDDYRVYIVIDGLSKTAMAGVRSELKKTYRKIRQNPRYER